MTRATLDLLTTLAVLATGLASVGLLCWHLGARELGVRVVSRYRTSGLVMTVVFLVLVTLRFRLLGT